MAKFNAFYMYIPLGTITAKNKEEAMEKVMNNFEIDTSDPNEVTVDYPGVKGEQEGHLDIYWDIEQIIRDKIKNQVKLMEVL
jgi:hypothetical protein